MSAGGSHRGDVGAVIFDVDGLLLNTELLYKLSWQGAAIELGYALDDALYAQLAGHSRVACDAGLVAAFGTTFPLEGFHCAWSGKWKHLVRTGGVKIKPYATDILAMLRAGSVPMAVASSSNREFVELSLTEAHIRREFSVVVAGDEVQRSKPAPDIYLEAARRLGVDPAHCVALDDTEVGAAAATGAGMRTFLIPDMYSPRHVPHDVLVVRSLRDAAAIIQTWVGIP
jgi:HAD superfamily hydrolase (TIGR01509 family)